MSAILPLTSVGVRAPLRILLADDNEMLRAAIGGLLERLGHSVDVVTNGKEAVESAARKAFDVVFLDVQMPEMGGLEAASFLRRRCADGRRLRIVGFSGEGEEPGSYAAAGMDHFLVKPVRLTDLIHVIEHCGVS